MHYVRRSFWALVGVAVLGFGSAVLRVAQVGVDPYTAANIGISNTIGLDLGTYQLISNAVLLIPVFFLGRMYIGIGSIINMVMTGYFVQWFSALLSPLLPSEPTRLVQTVLFLIGITLFAAGASMYMTAALGNAPTTRSRPSSSTTPGSRIGWCAWPRTSRSSRWRWHSTDRSASGP